MNRLYAILIAVVVLTVTGRSQYCDSITPSFTANLSANPNASWISPDTAREGHCCGASNPDVCVEFIILLHPNAQGILFDIYSGAVPPGALYYQIDCGPIVAVGDPVCLNGPGPHHLTFCKPGNNSNQFIIESIPEPTFGPDVAITDGCNKYLHVSGFDESTIYWTSIAPDPVGTHDYFLDCTAQCDTVWVNWNNNAPPWVDYLVCGQGLGGCDTNVMCDTIRVYFTQTLSVNITPINPTVCFGASGTTITANPSGGSGPYSYVWSNGVLTQSNFVGQGSYVVELSDTSGCPSVTDTVVVGQFNLPIEVDGGNDINVCIDELPVVLNGTYQAAGGINWSTNNLGIFSNSTDPNATYTPSNNDLLNGFAELYIETTGNGSCPPDHDTITLYFHDFTANIFLQADNVTCNGAGDGSASVTVTGNNGPYSLAWNGDPNLGSSSINNLTPGNYSLTIRNANGCDSTISFIITEPSALQFDGIGLGHVSCHGANDGSISIQASGGTGIYTYTVNSQTGTSAYLQNLSGGQYYVSVTDDNGCLIDTNVVLDEPTSIISTIYAPDSVCPQQGFLINLSTSGGTPGYSYSWNTGETTQDIVTNTASSSTYFVTITDNNGCVQEDSVSIGVHELNPLLLDLIGNSGFCVGDTVQLEAEYTGNIFGNPIYTWSHCSSCTGTGPYFDVPSSSTEYIVSINDACGQSISDTLSVDVHPKPLVNLPDTLAEGCEDLYLNYSLPGNMSYSQVVWEMSNGSMFLGQDVITTIYDPGVYTIDVTAYSNHGCFNSVEDALVIVHPKPKSNFYADNYNIDTYSPTVDFTNGSLGAASWEWDFGDGSTANSWDAEHDYNIAGSYVVTLTVESEHGCRDTSQHEIDVREVVNIYIPNAFTPDGDGINDNFNIVGENLVDDEYSLLIFDRWGENIFASRALNNGWDGTYKGEIVKTDIYVYQVQVYDIFGDKHQYTGHVSLLK